MHPYATSLKTLLEQNADPAQAAPMKKYMRDQFEYLGIKSPQLKALFRQAIKENGVPSLEELDQVVRELWDLPQREYQYLAISLMERLEKKLGLPAGEMNEKFYLRETECLGSCGTAPCLQINENHHENLTREKLDAILEKLS